MTFGSYIFFSFRIIHNCNATPAYLAILGATTERLHAFFCEIESTTGKNWLTERYKVLFKVNKRSYVPELDSVVISF